MIISKTDRKDIINYLVRITKYKKRFYEKMHDDQLYAVYLKYSAKHETYVKILSKVDEFGNSVSGYTQKQLSSFKIDKLIEIYQDIYLTEEIIHTEDYSMDNDKDYQYLTADELTMIFGLDYLEMNNEDFKKYGYYEIDNDKSLALELKMNIFDEICKIIIEGYFLDNKGHRYTLKKLKKLDFNELVILYRYLTNGIDNYPTYEEIEGRLRLMKN